MAGLTRTAMRRWKSIRQKILPRTLFARSLMIMLTPVLLLQLTVAFVFFDRHWDTMTDKLVTTLAGEVGLVVENLQTAGTEEETRRVLRQAMARLGLGVTIEEQE